MPRRGAPTSRTRNTGPRRCLALQSERDARRFDSEDVGATVLRHETAKQRELRRAFGERKRVDADTPRRDRLEPVALELSRLARFDILHAEVERETVVELEQTEVVPALLLRCTDGRDPLLVTR